MLEVKNDLAALPKVAGDPVELREALTNLILNAVDAMPGGGVLTLTTAVVDGEVVVTVSDTGVGIPSAIRDRVFDPFFTTKGPQGTGLGLSMTYAILERHGARITVNSEEGRGTTFRLTFVPTWELAEPPTEPPAPPPSGEVSLRCLVVDDEPTVGAMLGDVLETGGHRAVVVTDGSEGIARFGAEPFDVVFTDLAMPRVSGWQVARAIKEMAPAVPVIVVTGFGVELSAEERRAHGVDLVLVKPLNRPDALNALNLALGRELFHAALDVDDDPSVRCVVITGAGKAFCAGGDVKDFADNLPRIGALVKELTTYLHGTVSRLARSDKPVIMAVNGVAAGGGFSFALSGDLVIAAESARFTMAYSKIAATPDGSSSYFLPRLVGLRRAMELYFTNRVLSAREALEWGLVTRVVPDAELANAVHALARELAQGPSKAFGGAKRLFHHSTWESLETQMELEAH